MAMRGIPGIKSELFKVGFGLRQMFVLSPLLFVAFMESKKIAVLERHPIVITCLATLVY